MKVYISFRGTRHSPMSWWNREILNCLSSHHCSLYSNSPSEGRGTKRKGNHNRTQQKYDECSQMSQAFATWAWCLSALRGFDLLSWSINLYNSLKMLCVTCLFPYSLSVPSILCFQGNKSWGDNIFSIFIGDNSKKDLFIEGLFQQFEHFSTLTVVG